MNELALFAGAGGGILGGKLLGWRTVCAVEIDDYCRRVLMQRQDDGCLDPFPIWDDVRTFDGRPWRGVVDVVSGGFPCQDISVAGGGAGIDGERSGLWAEMSRIIGEVRPRFAYMENSPALTSRGLDRVLGDLAEMGYDARWGVISAADAIWFGGTPEVYHERKRIWIVGWNTNCNCEGEIREVSAGPLPQSSRASSKSIAQGANSVCFGLSRSGEHGKSIGAETSETRKADKSINADWWITEPDVGRVAHGVASRVDRLRVIGNGQVPAVAALAWQILTGDESISGS